MRTGTDCRGRLWEEISLGKAKDLTNKKFFSLTPLFRVKNMEDKNSSNAYWLCECECGNQIIANSKTIQINRIKSCGCRPKDPFLIKDLTGEVFGNLTVLEEAGRKNVQRTSDKTTSNVLWKCQCNCGNIIYVITNSLTTGNTTSCGCSHKGINNKRWEDLSGQKFNKLLVLERDFSKTHVVYKCLCDCGNITYVDARHLKKGDISSCGCIKSKGEALIQKILTDNNIKFIHDKGFFKDLITSKNGYSRYDFIILDENDNPVRIIEFDGIQHFKEISTGAWNLDFSDIHERDKIKNEYAWNHNIPIIRIPYYDIDKICLNSLFDDTFLIRRGDNDDHR